MTHDKTNELIELIYESALRPEKWTDLLNALAEYVDHIENQFDSVGVEQSIRSVIPALADSEEKHSKTSISETLKSITNISEEQSLQKPNHANNLLIGHFARALKIAKKLVDIDEQHNIVLSLLDRMPIALVLVDSNAQVVETNSLADELILSETKVSTNENILDVGKENNIDFLKLVKQMSKHDSATTHGQCFALSASQDKNTIMLFVAPLQKMDLKQSASVAVFISQQKSQPVSLPYEFLESYGLTNKEMQITELLVKGLSIKEISEQKSVSAHTVRSQVKSVMQKTGTSRQAELVGLVYNRVGDFVKSLQVIESGTSGILNKTKLLQRDYQVYQLKDGRNLAYAEYGDLNGEPIFHCHSVLGSRLELALNAEKILQEKSVRLIILDRPGYGASDSNPNHSFIHWVKDLVELADFLQIKKFSVMGYVMGGTYALACAHEIPDRLKNVTVISTGVAQSTKEEFAATNPLYRLNLYLAKYVPKIYPLIIPVITKGITSDPKSVFKKMEGVLGKEDKKLVDSDEFKDKVFQGIKEGFRTGGKTAGTEILQHMHGWEFEPDDITIPVDIWHGTEDCLVPHMLSERFKGRISKARFHTIAGQGHYLFYTHWEEIIEQMLESIKSEES